METDIKQISEVRRPFTLWKVGDDEYKLKLKTSNVVVIEDTFGGESLIQTIMESDVLPLKKMMIIIKEALQTFHHGKSIQDAFEIYDAYVENGGSQIDLYKNVILPLCATSGFFTVKQSRDMLKNLAQEDIETEG